MENLTEITLDLITVTDPSILRAIKHVRTQAYSEKAVEKDSSKKDRKVSIFVIGGKTFNADSEDPISKIILGNKQSELYSISFTKGEDYTDSRNVVQQGINYSSKLTKKERQEDVTFQQDLIIEESRAELHILREKAEIKVSAKEAMSMIDLEEVA